MAETLLKQIKLVATARLLQEQVEAYLRTSKLAWEKEHHWYLNELAVRRTECQQAEATLRELALVAYRLTGDKHPAPGVDIREGEELIFEEAKALEWAKINSPAMVKVSLNVPLFKKLAKELKPNFVTFKPTYQATIATDLEKILKEMSNA